MPSSGMDIVLLIVRTDILEERIASIISVKNISSELASVASYC
jgi:hypothetical protein